MKTVSLTHEECNLWCLWQLQISIKVSITAFQNNQFGEGQSGMVLPSTPAPDSCFETLVLVQAILAVLSKYYEFPQAPRRQRVTLPFSTILHSSRAGSGLAPLYVTGACSEWYLAIVLRHSVNLAHCSPYIETLQLGLIQKEKEGKRV